MPKIEKEEELDKVKRDIDTLNEKVFNQDDDWGDYQSEIIGMAALLNRFRLRVNEAKTEDEEKQLKGDLVETAEQLEEKLKGFSEDFPELAKGACEEAYQHLDVVVKANKRQP